MAAAQVDRLAAIEARQGRSSLQSPISVNATPSPLGCWVAQLDTTGIAFAALFFCWSLSPSLLPRDWLFQGIIGGINAAIGYGLGCVVGWAVTRFVLRGRSWWPLPLPVERAIMVAVPVAGVLAALVALVLAAGQQRQLAALMNAEGTTTSGYLRTCLLSLAVAALLISLWRGLRDIGRWIAGQLIRRTRMPVGLARTLAVMLVVLATFMLIDGVLLRVAYAITNSAFSSRTTPPGQVRYSRWTLRNPEAPNPSRRGRPWVSRAGTSCRGGWTPTNSPRSTASPRRSRFASTSGSALPKHPRNVWISSSTSSSGPARSTAPCWRSSPRRGPAGSIPRPRRRWNSCTTAMSRWSRGSTRSCRAGSRSSPTRRRPRLRARC